MLAAQRGRRPEKLKQDMAKDGTLANLYVQMREQKAIDKVLETRHDRRSRRREPHEGEEEGVVRP